MSQNIEKLFYGKFFIDFRVIEDFIEFILVFDEVIV